jgi:hypothetical protein
MESNQDCSEVRMDNHSCKLQDSLYEKKYYINKKNKKLGQDDKSSFKLQGVIAAVFDNGRSIDFFSCK